MAFTLFNSSLNDLKGLTNPFQLSGHRGPATIHQDGDGLIYVGRHVANPAKVTLRECIEILMNKPAADRHMAVYAHSGGQLDLTCLDKTIVELLSEARGYTVLLEGSVEFFYRHVLTKEQALLSEDEQFELFETYKTKFL
jgi:hypothetical protein